MLNRSVFGTKLSESGLIHDFTPRGNGCVANDCEVCGMGWRSVLHKLKVAGGHDSNGPEELRPEDDPPGSDPHEYWQTTPHAAIPSTPAAEFCDRCAGSFDAPIHDNVRPAGHTFEETSADTERLACHRCGYPWVEHDEAQGGIVTGDWTSHPHAYDGNPPDVDSFERCRLCKMVEEASIHNVTCTDMHHDFEHDGKGGGECGVCGRPQTQHRVAAVHQHYPQSDNGAIDGSESHEFNSGAVDQPNANTPCVDCGQVATHAVHPRFTLDTQEEAVIDLNERFERHLRETHGTQREVIRRGY